MHPYAQSLTLSTIALIVDPAHLETMAIPALNNQLEHHCQLSIKAIIPKKSHFKSKRQYYLVLQMLIDHHTAQSQGEAVDANIDFLAKSI
jgi:hypothetical protein